MIISNIIGGLGNQMFQFACGLAVALRRQTELKVAVDLFAAYSLHYGYELPRVFVIEPSIATDTDLARIISWRRAPSIRRLLAKPQVRPLLGSRFIAEPSFRHWPGLANAPCDAYLHGYWQSERYFQDYQSEVREAFRFRAPLSSENVTWAERITRAQSVSLHVRRGDYISAAKNRTLYAPCSRDYYLAAMDHLRSKCPEATFFAFSDDQQWVRDELASRFERVELVTHNRGVESHNDMRLMSLCRHHIIANSTFSWWGAWLNPRPDKVVIAPGAWLGGGVEWPEITPDTWLRL